MKSSVVFNVVVPIAGCRFELSVDKSYFNAERTAATLHSHANHEIHVVKQGRYHLEINHTDICLEAGSVCLIPPNAYHSNAKPLDDQSVKYCFRFDYACPDSRTNMIQKTLEKIDTVVVFQDCDRETQLAEEVVREYQRSLLDSQSCIDHLFYLIMLYLIRRIIKENNAAGTIQTNLFAENRATAIDEFFAIHYQDDIHAGDLAEWMNLSIRQLDRVMRKHYGMTFKQKLTEMRIFAAIQLLLETSLTIQDISQKVGYNNIETFCTSFNTRTGYTPSSYRKMNIKRSRNL